MYKFNTNCAPINKTKKLLVLEVYHAEGHHNITVTVEAMRAVSQAPEP